MNSGGTKRKLSATSPGAPPAVPGSSTGTCEAFHGCPGGPESQEAEVSHNKHKGLVPASADTRIAAKIKGLEKNQVAALLTMPLLIVLCLLGLALFLLLEQDTPALCGYESCNQHKPDVLNVHIVAHTHNDVGWLKTADQYFYGTHNNIQHAGVQQIIDSVVKELWHDPKRRFVYVETFYFFKWWHKQSDKTKQKVHTLVREGRLQFAGGAWTMNDEAAVHYHSTIDQFTFGLRLLNDTFGKCGLPTVGWQIDPFGHSREFASLLAAMGYDGVILGRIDYQDRENRINKTTMEMLWRGDDDLGAPSDIFAGVLYKLYGPPDGFCFDMLCSDAPIVADRKSPKYNVVDKRVRDFLEVVKKMSRAYASKNILVTMGGDFHYQNAFKWFDNLDKLIRYTNMKAAKEGLKLHLFYSTPQCYLKAVKDSNPTLPTKRDDFFPYAMESSNYWTGYYTSRPTTKYFERETNRYLQMAKQLQVMADLEARNMFVLNELKSALGIMQHHDAITGTEKQHVTHDYERILNNAIEDALIIPRQALNKYEQGDAKKQPILSYERCRLNESSCNVSEKNEQFVVTVYNHLAWKRNEPIRIPVIEGNYEVYAPMGDKINSQLVDIPAEIIKIPTRVSEATHEIVFIAHLKPLSYKSYYIRKIKNEEFWKTNYAQPAEEKRDREKKSNYSGVKGRDVNGYRTGYGYLEDLKQVKLLVQESSSKAAILNEEMSDDPRVMTRYPDDLVLENQHLKLRVTPLNQLAVTSPRGDVTLQVKYCFYPTTSSGAYIFRPNSTTPEQITGHITQGPKGDVVQEIRMTNEENVFSSIRIYDGLNYIENDWVVGPIVITKDLGKEIIVRYNTNIINNGEFYTDSNGRQMLKRKLGYRPQWNVTLTEPVAANYYPIVNKISIHHDNLRIAVITDRAEGGSSLEEGSIEVMLHRRLVRDDGKGLYEVLNETVLNGTGLVVRGKHRILISDPKNKTDYIQEKKEVLEVDMEPQVFISDAKSLSLQDWLRLKNSYSWVNDLPDGLHLLTLEPWKDNTILIRFENYLQLSDNNDKEKTTLEVDLNKFFKTLKVKSMKETALAANRWLGEVKQWSWKTKTGFYESETVATKGQDNGFKIKIKAKQIRTFIVEYERI